MVFGFHHISLFSTRESSLTQKIEPELTKFSLFSTECERCRIDSHSDIHLHRSLVCDLFSTSLQASDESCRLCDCNYLAHCTPLQFTWILCTSHLYPTTEIWCSIIHTMHNQLDWRARNEIMHHKGGVSLHVSCTLFLWKLSQLKLNITFTRLPLVLIKFLTDKIQQFSHGESNSTTIAQLKARRKASKMLVAVVIMFAVCYFPVHALNIYRYTVKEEQSEILTILSLLSHWLCYANSAMNPLIYNFMSGEMIVCIVVVQSKHWSVPKNPPGKFRREFKNVLERGHCLTQRTNPRNQHWTSQYRSRYGNDEQEHSFIQSTTHMINVTPSLRRNFGCSVVSVSWIGER